MGTGARTGSIAAMAALTLLAVGSPAVADGPIPPGISGWVLRSDYSPPMWDGFYVKRTGSWLKFAYVNGLEGACGKGTLNGNSAALKRYGYGPSDTVRSTFRRSGKSLYVTTFWPEGTSTRRYVRKPLGETKRLMEKGRQADMGALPRLRSC